MSSQAPPPSDEVPAVAPSRSRRDNNFGALRLVFAWLVIVSHSFELIDGSRVRELLTRAFHTLSFGEFAVDGSFLVSGYLIAQSAEQRRSTVDFLVSRALRIFPGFVVAFGVSLVMAGVFGGGDVRVFDAVRLLKIPYHALMFDLPAFPGAFAGLPYPSPNGSVWTIVYEVRCYLIALVLVAAGGTRGRGRVAVAVATAGLLVVAAVRPPVAWPYAATRLFGDPVATARLTGVFGVGVLFYAFRDRLRYRGGAAALCAVALVVLLRQPRLAEAALAVLGGYVLFWFALAAPVTGLSRANNRADVSYGLYLYAWPIQNALIWNIPGVRPLTVIVVTTIGAVLFGYASWRLIEQPALAFKRRFAPRAR